MIVWFRQGRALRLVPGQTFPLAPSRRVRRMRQKPASSVNPCLALSLYPGFTPSVPSARYKDFPLRRIPARLRFQIGFCR